MRLALCKASVLRKCLAACRILTHFTPITKHHSLLYSVAGSINLMQVMSEYNCKKMVFSSSATVYGETNANPIKETEPLGATSPYGRSKLMVEDMLRDQCKADP